MSRPIGPIFPITCVVFLLCVCTSAMAIDRYVPASYLTIQAAVDAATDGDEIILQSGTYSGPGNRDVNFNNKAVLIRSTNPDDPAVVAATRIDCQDTQASPHVAITIDAHTSEGLHGVAGVTIVGASSETGAIVFAPYSNGVVRNCVITGNDATGIYCGIYSYAAISRCRLEDNGGGGIVLVSNCRATIQGCVIRANSGNLGGGIYAYSSWPVITDCEISDNEGVQAGGGIYFEDSPVKLVNCTVSGNQAGSGGGLCGVASLYNDLAVIRNSIVWDNTATRGAQLSLETDAPWFNLDTLSVAYSLVQGGSSGVAVPAGWSLDWQSSNLAGSVNPLFVRTGPVSMGPTGQQTNVRLRSSSPCVDVGDPALDYSSQTDAAGQLRILGSWADIGAYETAIVPAGALLLGDVNGDGAVDILDVQRMVASWATQTGQPGFDAATDLDQSGLVNVRDLLLLAQDFGRAV